MITGSIVALVTPMHPDGSLDFPALSALLEWHVDSGTSAVVAVGTTGESATLSVDEHYAVIKHTVEAVAGRIPVIAGTGANSTLEAIEWTATAKKLGADACLLVTPYYNKPSQRGLIAHYKAVADAVDIPQILYNVPSRTACDMLPDTICALAEHRNIVGVKEATGDIRRCSELQARCPADFALYSGDDATALEFILAGGKGNISVTANVVPQVMAQICTLALAGKQEEARTLNRKIEGLHKDLFLESNPVPVKWALQAMGRIKPGIRLPLVELDKQYQATLLATLKQTGAL